MVAATTPPYKTPPDFIFFTPYEDSKAYGTQRVGPRFDGKTIGFKVFGGGVR
jgi:hypothetical protein